MTNGQNREIKIIDYSDGRSVVSFVRNVSGIRGGQEVQEEEIKKWIEKGIDVTRS